MLGVPSGEHVHVIKAFKMFWNRIQHCGRGSNVAYNAKCQREDRTVNPFSRPFPTWRVVMAEVAIRSGVDFWS